MESPILFVSVSLFHVFFPFQIEEVWVIWHLHFLQVFLLYSSSEVQQLISELALIGGFSVRITDRELQLLAVQLTSSVSNVVDSDAWVEFHTVLFGPESIFREHMVVRVHVSNIKSLPK